MRDETQRKADARLARIGGQISAVRKMVAEDRYCIDVVTTGTGRPRPP